MSGTPTEIELQGMWQDAVDILETTRVHADSTLAGASGKFDTLIQALEGEYTPTLANTVAAYRAGVAGLIDQSITRQFLEPIIFEYSQILQNDATYGFGAGYNDIDSLFGALYEHFVNNGKTVQSRAITYGTPSSTGTGNTTLTRLTEDENGFNLEFCHVERKRFRCRNDQNTGVSEFAEEYEFLGELQSRDSLLRASFGSGESERVFIVNKNAGSGSGGSLLRNSTFTDYDATNDNDFDGWELVSGTVPTQDTSNYYVSHPGAESDGTDDSSMKFVAGTSARLKQTIDLNSNLGSLDPNVPYFCRMMVNADIGSASGGSAILHLGSKTATLNLANFGTGWNEVRIGDTSLDGSEDPSDCWFKNFNSDPFDIEVEWNSASSGQLIIDDLIFVPWDLVDGTYWIARHAHPSSPTSPLRDHTFTATDSGGAPTTAKIQWWLWIAGLGYLPSTTGTPTFTDP